MIKKIYYIYYHIDPTTDEIMYVGHGYKDRAWICGSTTRGPEHQKWYMNLINMGYLPDSIVELVETGLTKSDACQKEQEIIRRIDTAFNKPQGLQNLKMSDELRGTAQHLRAEGLFYREIAARLNLSTMTIYRALNGQTKNLR